MCFQPKLLSFALSSPLAGRECACPAHICQCFFNLVVQAILSLPLPPTLQVTILLLGKSGAGKSSTANSLLGERVAQVSVFQVRDGPAPDGCRRQNSKNAELRAGAWLDVIVSGGWGKASPPGPQAALNAFSRLRRSLDLSSGALPLRESCLDILALSPSPSCCSTPFRRLTPPAR